MLQFFLLWLLYGITSLIWAQSTGDAIKDIVMLLMGVSLLWFAVYYMREQDDLEKFLWVWLSLLVASICVGFWEHITGQHLSGSKFFGATNPAIMYNPTAFFHNPNDFATFLTLSIPFAFSLGRHGTTRLTRVVALGVGLAATYMLVSTGSRANMVAWLVQLVFWITFMTSNRRKALLIPAGIVLLVIGLGFIPGSLPTPVAKIRDGVVSLTTEGAISGRSVSVRTNLIRNSIYFTYKTIGVGVGAGNAEHWMANYALYDLAGIQNVHNWWFEILTNYGIGILAGYVLVYVTIATRLWRIWRHARVVQVRMLGEGLLLSFVGMPIAVASPSSVMGFNPNWLLFAFALTFLNLHSRSLDCVNVAKPSFFGHETASG